LGMVLIWIDLICGRIYKANGQNSNTVAISELSVYFKFINIFINCRTNVLLVIKPGSHGYRSS
jgi:hypothetical protein